MICSENAQQTSTGLECSGYASPFSETNQLEADTMARPKGIPAWNKGLKYPCYKTRGNKNIHWKGGKKIHKGYLYIKTNSHPFCEKRGYMLEHRLIMEKHLGRYLKPEEVVHHINGNTQNNEINNLKLYSSKGKHTNYHARLRGQKSIRPNDYKYTMQHRTKIGEGIRKFYEQKRTDKPT